MLMVKRRVLKGKNNDRLKINIKICQYCHGSNPRLLDYEQNALPAELARHIVSGTNDIMVKNEMRQGYTALQICKVITPKTLDELHLNFNQFVLGQFLRSTPRFSDRRLVDFYLIVSTRFRWQTDTQGKWSAKIHPSFIKCLCVQKW